MIAICLTTTGDIPIDASLSVNQLMAVASRAGIDVRLGAAHSLVNGRNDFCREVLRAPSISHVLFIDASAVIPPDGLARLLTHRKPVVGALSFADCVPALVQVKGKGVSVQYDFAPGGVVECSATLATMLLVERRVIEQMDIANALWWTPPSGSDLDRPVFAFEASDLAFCKRAVEAGFPIVVDTSVIAPRFESLLITAEMVLRNRAPRKNAFTKGTLTWQGGAPLATIVIPTFNTPEIYLLEAIEAACSQTVPVEVIVVDDGSTGGGPAIESETLENGTTVRVVRHEKNRGIAEALNAGIDAASTDWIAWCSADDLFHPGKIEAQLQAALNTGALALFTGYELDTDGAHATLGVTPPKAWASLEEQRVALAASCWVNGSTTLIHKSVFAAVGKYDPEYRYGQDWEMWNRVGEKFLWHFVPEILGTRRERGGNLTTALAANPEKWMRKMEEDDSIRRRYGAGGRR